MAIKIQISTTIYNGEKTFRDFYKSCLGVISSLDNVKKPVEMTIVDDGSNDRSSQVVKECSSIDPEVMSLRLVTFTRNFGHHRALISSLETIDKDTRYVFLIDSDGEEDPKYLTEMLRLIESDPDKVDVVQGVQQGRKGNFVEREFGQTAWKIMQHFSSYPIIENATTMRLMTSQVAKNFRKFSEPSPIVGVIQSYMGARVLQLKVSKGFKGDTTYTPLARAKLLFGFLLSETKFLRILSLSILFFGILLSALSMVWFLIYGLTVNDRVPGFATMGVLVGLFSISIFSSLSVVVILLAKNLEASRDRPRHFILNGEIDD